VEVTEALEEKVFKILQALAVVEQVGILAMAEQAELVTTDQARQVLVVAVLAVVGHLDLLAPVLVEGGLVFLENLPMELVARRM
jgi:hypothetical protein